MGLGLCHECKIEEAKYNNRKCKRCNTEYHKKYRKTEKYKEYSVKEHAQNRQKRLDQKKKYYQEHKAERAAYMREWKAKNPEQKRINAIRSYISSRLKDRKNQSTIEYLGCSWEEYFVYLGGLFDDNMSWENYGTYWEIDHIHPLSKGGSFHFTNTQPLSVSENRSKGNKIIND